MLDWDRVHASSPLFDLGTLLRREADLPAGFAASVESGFREGGGELSPGWQRSARLCDLVNLCVTVRTSRGRHDVADSAIAAIVATIRALES